MKNKNIVIVSIVVLAAIFIGAASFYKSNETSALQNMSQSEAPFVRPHSMILGENKKNITVVEFLDPECEACGYFHGAVKAMYKDYYEDIRLVVRYLDNHKNSKYAVKILESARKQNKYSEVLDVVFSTQGIWAQHNNERPELLWQHLPRVDGLDMKKLREDFDTINVDDMLAKDREDARTLKVRGTPSFFVNGKKLEKLSGQGLMDLVEGEIYK